jgi:hypothetical protein
VLRDKNFDGFVRKEENEHLVFVQSGSLCHEANIPFLWGLLPTLWHDNSWKNDDFFQHHTKVIYNKLK